MRQIRMRLVLRTVLVGRLATVDDHAYRVGVGDDIMVIGDEPLVDGMNISLRYRRDLVGTHAAPPLDAAPRGFCGLEPPATPPQAAAPGHLAPGPPLPTPGPHRPLGRATAG